MNLYKIWLVAGERPTHLYIISKVPLYNSVNPGAKEKKIRLDAGIDVTISSREDLESGVVLNFEPDMDIY